jgi:molybdate/tungstate transport system permease protein
VFRHISLPLASKGILAGVVMAWARAVSESGALMIMAYEPKTASLFIYDQFVQYGLEESLPYAALLLIFGFWIFLVIRWLGYLRRQGIRGVFLLGGAE